MEDFKQGFHDLSFESILVYFRVLTLFYVSFFEITNVKAD